MRTIALSGKKGAGRTAVVDDEDWSLVAAHRWRLVEYYPVPGQRLRGPYAVTSIRREDGRWTSRQMHNLITGWPLTDHIDHDGLNNQRSNLRSATAAQNQQNRRSAIGSSSQYKGVYWCRQRSKWRTRITVNGSRRMLGLFVSEEDAALAYNTAALEAFGAYACLNQVEMPALDELGPAGQTPGPAGERPITSITDLHQETENAPT